MNWPPHFPPEWLQLMQSGMQSGMVPPPLPGLNFPPPSVPHTPQAPATPIAFPPHFPPPPAAPSSVSAAHVERVQEVMDSEREDGEVSDAEGFLRTPSGPAGIAMRQRYEPPRSAPQLAATPSRVEEAYNPDKPSAGQTTKQPSAANGKQHASATVTEMDLVQQQREEAKQFIRLLNANNVGYHALAKEKIDLELLRSLYRSMNLPSEPEPIPPPKTNGTAVTQPPTDSQASTTTKGSLQKSVPPVSTNIAVASTASAAPSPVDRKDYLARLQAAKLARQTGPAKASPPQKSPSVVAASPATGVGTPQATITPTKKPPATDERGARQTELIKQRLEALKAQSKQNAAASNNAVPKPASSQHDVQQSATPGASSAASQFSGIPGLFMNAPLNASNGTSTSSRQPQAVPQKRPAPSDTSLSTPRGSVTPYNRAFGQSPHAQQEDSMIIEVSDEESNGSDMDIDDDQATSGSLIRHPPGSIPGFPPRPFVPAAASAVSTPGPQTPATIARTGELSTKEQELAALKLTLKKKLAEQKRIKEAAEAANAAASTSATAVSGITLPETPSKQHQVNTATAGTAATVPSAASTSSGDSSRERKRRRRTEIQEQLPSLDDEIASNAAEMARLAKDLERLKANNERIMQDKERLTKELEDLGIDTEGMSHADMQATKDEIERAKSPEVETVPQGPSTQKPFVTTESGNSPTALVRQSVPSTETTTMRTPASIRSPPGPPQFGFLPGLGQAAPKSLAREPAPLPAQNQSTGALQDLQRTTDPSAPVEAPRTTNMRNDRASATPMDDDEDFYSPPPVDVDVNGDATVEEALEPQVEPNSATAPSPSEEGEVEMSVSSEEDEEEYEPEEPMVDEPRLKTPAVDVTISDEHVPEPASQQAQVPEPAMEHSQSVGQSQVSTEDEEAYEPPDVDEEMTELVPSPDAAHSGAVQSEASSPEDADDGAMDIATSSDDSSDDSDSDSDGDTQSELGNSESQRHVPHQDVDIADDLAPQLQPETSLQIVPVAEQSPDVSTPPLRTTMLTGPGAG